jgi:hypothetical protein
VGKVEVAFVGGMAHEGAEVEATNLPTIKSVIFVSGLDIFGDNAAF